MSCTVLIFIIYVNKRLNLFIHFILPSGDLKKAVMMRFLNIYIYMYIYIYIFTFIYRYMKMHTNVCMYILAHVNFFCMLI